MNNEIELKLLIAPADTRRLQRLPLLKQCTQRTLRAQRLFSIYYDTPDLELHKKAVAVRLRRVGRRWIQTVKTAGTITAGLHDRPEWENETQENTLDFHAIGDDKLRNFLRETEKQHELRPVFTTDFTRSRRMLVLSGTTLVEFALDRGEVRADGKQTPICEVELELKSGDPAQLFTFALTMHEIVPVRLANTSKAERGYQLATGARLAPVKATPVKLGADLSVSAAFVHIEQNCLSQLQANEEGALQKNDPEFIHQTRIAVRRLRSACSLFSDVVPRRHSAPRAELRWLAGELDGARNWDVFASETLPPILAAFPQHTALRQLQAISSDIRKQHTLRARTTLASPRYHKLLLNLGACLTMQPWRDTNEAQPNHLRKMSLSQFTAAILHKRYKQLKKRGEDLASLAPPDLHTVRIAVKKLRYATEFFSALYKHKATRKYTAALCDLQDVLGALNDAATTMILMREIAAADQANVTQTAQDVVQAWVSGARHTKREELAAVWRHFIEQKPFW